MRGARRRGLAGAAIAVALGVAVLYPVVLSGPDPSPGLALECLGSACEPGPPGLVDRIEVQLAERLPDLEEAERRLLARTIVGEAGQARIDPVLVLALIQVESSWDLDALSVRGARGLMQLREPTMRRELERAGLVLEDPHDPVANVQAGVRYLRRLLDAFGREEVALMAYNAGPNRILRYLREGAIPQRFHVYPRRVRAEVRRLRRDLGHGPPLLAEAHAAPVAQ